MSQPTFLKKGLDALYHTDREQQQQKTLENALI